ncbi:hypothetical protein ABZ446_42380 [Streptomyces sp. NPDC005813]|uniref:hypothetical protein n=1 Tax=Streptomyces sp. NPDC005813 TaxID=3155592 RepID=UPI0033F923A3
MPQPSPITATFPLSDRSLAVVCASADVAAQLRKTGCQLAGGGEARVREEQDADPTVLLIDVDTPHDAGLHIDQIVAPDAAELLDGNAEFIGPRFVHGIRTPMELRMPQQLPVFPFGSSLEGLHVSVACCTGCNGGIHDRHLVVINTHSGGSWSGIWINTPQEIPVEYRRWQKVQFLGGVLREVCGSTTVVDDGWMRIKVGAEEGHAAPAPAHVTTADFPATGTRSLLARSLEAAWVQVSDATVVDARHIDKPVTAVGEVRLPRVETRLRDSSGQEAIAWLHQPSAFGLARGDSLSFLRGFLHAERPGWYVLLSDKDDDLLRAQAQ